MKKILFSAFFLGTSAHFFAQNTTVTFETLPLSGANSFYNGGDDAGQFSVGDVSFSNNYNADWQSWNGFSYSNVTDNITAGYANQFSAFPGSGAGGSEQYAIFYPEGIIQHSGSFIPDSIKISNATYAAISMRDGDAYGKQFGSSTNAAGDLDGTNGEDFFKVWIIGYDIDFEPIDSVEFYLADFRFSDNLQDYIVDEWVNVDLSSLGEVHSISFKLESSDIGSFGMNTPAYFVLDDFSFHTTLSTAQLEQYFHVYPNPVGDLLTISGGKGTIRLTDLQGKVLHTEAHSEFTTIDFSNLSIGTYMLQLELNGIIYHKTIVK
jgi:hypothetical protein